MGDCCDPEEEFRQAQEALQKLAQRLADGRLRQIRQKIKQQQRWDNAPRHTEYQGHNVSNGGLVKSLGGDAVARQPISNGWLKPGDVVELGKGGFDFKPRTKANEEEEEPTHDFCVPGTIYKFISLRGTTQHLPFKFLSLDAKPTEAQLKRIKQRWRLVEVGASGTSSVIYGTGYVKGSAFAVLSNTALLFNASNSSFTSAYDYPGYMQLQIGCYDGKKVRWKFK